MSVLGLFRELSSDFCYLLWPDRVTSLLLYIFDDACVMKCQGLVVWFVILINQALSFVHHAQLYQYHQRRHDQETRALSVALTNTLDVSTVDIAVALGKASAKAFSGGQSGALAGGVQVLSLMWLRTTINFQYRFGLSTAEALRTLWEEGGIQRLYQGLPFALLQGPLSRFGDTASNTLIFAFLEEADPTNMVPTYARTGLASLSAGLWRIVLLPIDTVKTSLQVNGDEGVDILKKRVDKDGIKILFNGALASSAATFVGHYPWFLTYNLLGNNLLTPQEIIDHHVLILSSLNPFVLQLLRSAFIGLCASSVSDVSSNSLRVLKTVRQTADVGTDQSDSNFSYITVAQEIIDKEGWKGFLGRGLKTKLISNGVQSAVFSVMYKYFSDVSSKQ